MGAVPDESALTMADTYQPENLPLIAEPWFGFVWLALWALVPLGLGLWRFGRTAL